MPNKQFASDALGGGSDNVRRAAGLRAGFIAMIVTNSSPAIAMKDAAIL